MICCDCLKDLPETYSFFQLFDKHSAIFQHCYFCKKKYKLIDKFHCPLCFRQQDNKKLCSDCQKWQDKKKNKAPHQAFFQYDAYFKDWLERFKYQGALHLKYTFQKELQARFKAEKALLVPVPMSEEKKKIRGFNQTEEILLGANLPYFELLTKKTGNEDPQSQKKRRERLLLPQVFEMKEDYKIKEVILIDDVYTTGTTLFRAQELLEENGYKVKMTFSLAR